MERTDLSSSLGSQGVLCRDAVKMPFLVLGLFWKLKRVMIVGKSCYND